MMQGFRPAMASSLFAMILGLAFAADSSPVTVQIEGIAGTTEKATNTTSNSSYQILPLSCLPCVPADEDDNNAGVIIGSFIGGAAVGVVVTVAVMLYFQNRSQAPPPKDYDDESGQVRFDVNRNNDEGGLIEDESDSKSTKPHKKLQRLVQRDPGDKPNLKTETAAVPLMQYVDMPSSAAKTEVSAAKDTDSKPKAASQDKDDTPEYLNVGNRSLLSQPYDSLDIVPEEVEYENQTQNDYEPIIDPVTTSSKA